MSAPSCSSTRAAAGFAAGSITEIFACMSCGQHAGRACIARTPRGRRGRRSGRCGSRARRRGGRRRGRRPPAPGRARPARATPPAGDAGRRRGVPARVRPREQADLDAGVGGRCGAISSSSSSVCRKTPLPCETRWTRTSSRSASSSTASRQRGPSVLGISTRYWAPSGKRFSESGRSFRSPGGSPIERRKSRVSLIGDSRPIRPAPARTASPSGRAATGARRAPPGARSSSSMSPQSSASFRSRSATVSSCAGSRSRPARARWALSAVGRSGRGLLGDAFRPVSERACGYSAWNSLSTAVSRRT